MVSGLISVHANENTRKQHDRSTGSSLISAISRKIKESATEKRKYTVDDIDELILNSSDIGPDHAKEDEDGDIPILEMDDQSEVERVSNYVLHRRDSEFQCPSSDYNEVIPKDVASYAPTMAPTLQKTVFVADTNFIISHLNTLEGLRQLNNSFHHQIVIPTMVIRELDGLKNSNKQVSRFILSDDRVEKEEEQVIGLLARWANNWIYKNLANVNSGVIGQQLRQRLDFNSIKDDAILDCCLYFREKLGCFVILLSNDKNLCMKALTEKLLTVSFRRGMSAQLIASKAYEENMNRAHMASDQTKNEILPQAQGMVQQQNDHRPVDIEMDDDIQIISNQPPPIQSISADSFNTVTSTVFSEIQSVVLSAVDYVMNEEYGDDLQLLDVGKNKNTTLRQAGNIVYKFWVAVFAEYFRNSRIKREIWKKQPSSLVNISSSPAELAEFVRFWCPVLECLYLKRDEEQNQALRILTERWYQASKQC